MRRPGPQGPLVILGCALLASFFTATAVVLVRDALAEDDAGLWIAALLLVAPLALVVWVAVLGNVLQHLFPRGLPAPRVTTHEGEPGVEVPEWSFGRRVVPVIVVVGTVSGLGLGLGALLSGRPAFAGGGLAAGVGGCWVIWQVARGRVGFAGGMVLTPTRLVHRYGHVTSVVTWDDVLDARPAGYLPGPDSEGVEVAVRAGSRVAVDTRWYGVPATALAGVVTTYAREPALRGELADDRGLERLLDAAYDVVRRRVAR